MKGVSTVKKTGKHYIALIIIAGIIHIIYSIIKRKFKNNIIVDEEQLAHEATHESYDDKTLNEILNG